MQPESVRAYVCQEQDVGIELFVICDCYCLAEALQGGLYGVSWTS